MKVLSIFLNIKTIHVILSLILFSINTLADVEVENSENYNLPYKARRSEHGLLLSVGMEKLDLQNYYSLISNTPISTMSGYEPLTMAQVELGYKHNFKLGSVYLLGSYSLGSVTTKLTAGSLKINVTKQAVAVGYSADMLFVEPYIVPYAQVGAHQFSVSEASNTSNDEATTEISLNYRIELQFQLNWIEKKIDKSTQVEALRSSGLENTYIDVYMEWFNPSNDLYDPQNAIATKTSDPDMTSESQLGVALKLEF